VTSAIAQAQRIQHATSSRLAPGLFLLCLHRRPSGRKWDSAAWRTTRRVVAAVPHCRGHTTRKNFGYCNATALITVRRRSRSSGKASIEVMGTPHACSGRCCEGRGGGMVNSRASYSDSAGKRAVRRMAAGEQFRFGQTVLSAYRGFDVGNRYKQRFSLVDYQSLRRPGRTSRPLQPSRSVGELRRVEVVIESPSCTATALSMLSARAGSARTRAMSVNTERRSMSIVLFGDSPITKRYHI
jgi:hypothetical protein